MRPLACAICFLLLALIAGCSARSSPVTTTNYPSAAEQSQAGGARVDNKDSKAFDCDDPQGYSLEEGTEPGDLSVKIVRGGAVLHSIKILSDKERNGFALNWAKKTKDGFEIAIEYGSRIYYGKQFVFVCRNHKFYLTKIGVESFDRQNPAKWSRKVIRVRPNVPLEKFAITDYMLEGVVQH